jgi:hypothetical protein
MCAVPVVGLDERAPVHSLARAIGVLAVASAITLAAAPARAGYYVSTAADTEAGASAYIFNEGYNYNVGANGLNGGVNLIGASQFGGCPSVTAPITCSVSGGGATSGSTGLTAATDQAKLTVGNTSIPYSVGASAAAIANLATGKVGVSASGDYDFVDGASGQYGGKGTAYAEDNDTLHFNVAGASPTTITPVGVTFTVDGSWTVATATGDSGGSVTAFLQFGNGQFLQGITNTGGSYLPAVQAPTINGGWDSESLSSDTPDQITFNGVYDLVGASPDVGFDMSLGAACGLGTGCDYSNTGAISLSLPSNVSFGSDSGVFLAEQSVPEPGTLAILGGAIVLLATFRRRVPRY